MLTKCCASCYSHAVALADGAFLSALSPPSKKKKNTDGQDEDVPILQPPSDSAADPSIDDEDTEEQITALADEIEAALKDLPADSEEVKNASKLLVKLRGFVAKVLCACFYDIRGSTFLVNRFDDHLKPRSISRNVAQMLRLQSLSFSHTAKLVGVPGMG